MKGTVLVLGRNLQNIIVCAILVMIIFQLYILQVRRPAL